MPTKMETISMIIAPFMMVWGKNWYSPGGFGPIEPKTMHPPHDAMGTKKKRLSIHDVGTGYSP